MQKTARTISLDCLSLRNVQKTAGSGPIGKTKRVTVTERNTPPIERNFWNNRVSLYLPKKLALWMERYGALQCYGGSDMRNFASCGGPPLVESDPVEQALSNALDVWASWLRAGKWVDGYPDHSPMFGSVHTGMDWEEWEESVDGALAQAVDAAVSGLTDNERAAVYCVKVASVYRLREPLQDVYLRARAKLLEALIRRGVLVL